MKSTDVVVIGAGAAGLMCAARAAQRGRSVMVLDHANKPGKKILMSGGGRCNFTNLYCDHDNFLSNNPHFCKSALSRYTPYDFIELVESHGVAYHEKTKGQLFCNEKASGILNMLLAECESAGATVHCKTTIHQITDRSGGFVVKTSMGAIECESLVVATGGLSIPTMGATGFGYDLAEQFGHSIVATMPGLVPFMFSDEWKSVCDALSGIALPITVTCHQQTFSDPMLFTHRGMSGPAMLQISSYWRPGDALVINTVPQLDLNDWLIARQNRGKNVFRTLLPDEWPKRLQEVLAEHWAWDLQQPIGSMGDELFTARFNAIQGLSVRPSSTEGYRTAEVTLGGVDTDGVSSKTLMSKQVDGLFFIGEVLDVTGHLGGHNFQWAWASAAAAGAVC